MTSSKIDVLQLYNTYYIDRDYEQVDLFRLLNSEFVISKVIYPGSYIHISPSFIFSDVVYIDSDKNAIKCFQTEQLIEMVRERKEYPEDLIITFHGVDYRDPIQAYHLKFDLLISQFAGFISEPCKNYLRIGGYLLVNNSHGDAGLASLDKDYKLISTVHRRKGKYRLSDESLDEYFIPKKDIMVTKEVLKQRMRGLGYTKTAALYIFQRVS